MLLIHAGFPKTGTTTLQFAFAAEARASDTTVYLGPEAGATRRTVRSIPFIGFARSIALGDRPDDLRRRFSDLMGASPNGSTHRHVIVSEEALSTTVPESWEDAPVWRNVERLIEASTVDPSDVTLVLSVRDSDTTLPSYYAQARRRMTSRFATVDEFIRFILDDGWPGYAERFSASSLLLGAERLGVRPLLLPLSTLSRAESVGDGGLLAGHFPWTRDHQVTHLNARRSAQQSWTADAVTAFDRLEVFARRLPIRTFPRWIYSGLKSALGTITLEEASSVTPSPTLLDQLRLKFGSIEAEAKALFP